MRMHDPACARPKKRGSLLLPVFILLKVFVGSPLGLDADPFERRCREIQFRALF